MSAINDLVNQIEDVELRKRIAKEVDKLANRKKFGLVFEDHLPECTPLYGIPVRQGLKVALKTGKINDVYIVVAINEKDVMCVKKGQKEEFHFNIDELTSIAEFGDPIYPYLKQMDSVCNAPDSDLWHTLIEADNYHALQLLEYLYAGKVDCIYIDPPYNTGAKDWKYNNDYVDNNDAYRHSKWLSMMKKRLKLAKKLLNPKDSVLIVTIDEKEYLHLGCLLEEMFPEANIQMVSSNIHHGGSNRKGEFSRTNEFIYFLRFGNSVVLGEKNKAVSDIKWRAFMRGDWLRRQRPNLFYPIYINRLTNKIVKIGQPLSLHDNKDDVNLIDGCDVVFPINTRNQESIWRLSSDTALNLLSKGFFKVNTRKRNKQNLYSFYYLLDGVINDIKEGRALIDGYDKQGSIIGHYITANYKIPSTQWVKSEHDASNYGTLMIRNIFCNDIFNFPKSLYAVKDCISFFVANKPNALIVDFFAGSGTTLHAVNLLNAEDGGKRRCIMVTNNEVSVDETKLLTKQGYHPGDDEWEKLGIARYVTWPRTVCSIEGHDVNGNALKGNYIGSDIPMSDGFKANAVYYKLGFLDKNAVALGRQLKELISILWMKAGAYGKCPVLEGEKIPDVMVYPENKFAVLNDEKAFSELESALQEHKEIETVFIVTDYHDGYCAMARKLKVKNTYQLYRDYLDNFRINTGRN